MEMNLTSVQSSFDAWYRHDVRVKKILVTVICRQQPNFDKIPIDLNMSFINIFVNLFLYFSFESLKISQLINPFHASSPFLVPFYT